MVDVMDIVRPFDESKVGTKFSPSEKNLEKELKEK